MKIPPKEGLKELITKRLEIKEVLAKKKEAIENIRFKIETSQAEAREISKKDQEVHHEFAKVNIEINDYVIPWAVEALEDHQGIMEVILDEDGDPALDIIDVREDAIEKAMEVKNQWREYIEKRAEDKKKVEEVKETIEKSAETEKEAE